MKNWIKDRLFCFALWALEKGGERIMNESTLKLFAATYVTLILAGRRELIDVPTNLQAYVKADLGMEE
ncbi:CD1375 family protein [Paenibacillus kandeliae]|uniref:CD1375 family protein n=1 Tax=Paenibacillus kandeliae TaxID=3231269 RepID=UPI003457CDA0